MRKTLRSILFCRVCRRQYLGADHGVYISGQFANKRHTSDREL